MDGSAPVLLGKQCLPKKAERESNAVRRELKVDMATKLGLPNRKLLTVKSLEVNPRSVEGRTYNHRERLIQTRRSFLQAAERYRLTGH
ncbi:MAG: hypothetical protein ACLVEJ_14740 [Parabacteroides sp.]